jgi:putative inorganic carbon (HCO3(-)) transporter
VLAIAALTGPLPKAGVIAAALLAAVVLLVRSPRPRAAAMVGALVLCAVLLLADIWHSSRLGFVHRHPLYAVVAALIALVVLVALARPLARRPWVLAPLAVIALPFRVPIQAGGTTSNLLVPLYLVVALGAVAFALSALTGSPSEPAASAAAPPDADELAPGASEPGAPGLGPRLRVWVPRLLALLVVLYALQATYSADFVKALQNEVFFYVPFAVLAALLAELDWDRPTWRACLRVTVGLAIVFSLIGFYEYATRTLLLNSKLIATNDLHTYFTVNSVFLDPDVFGRYLALVIVLLVGGLIRRRTTREHLLTIAVIAVLWACLVLTLSRSGLGALLVGMAVLAALRWRPSRAIIVGAAVVVIGAAAVAATPATFGLNQGINGASSGRGGLVSGGLKLFADRPLQGFGSGSFVTEYRRHHPHTASQLAASHTIPVTFAAEQGVIGELAYLAFVVAALALLLRGARGDPVRAAIAAAFVALVFDTLLYADFFEDPTTWVLLAAGLALARRPAVIRSCGERVVPSAT